MNAQVPCYVSWFSDINADANDAFSLSWENKKIYVFLPFSLIRTALAKIRRDRSTGDHDYTLVRNPVPVPTNAATPTRLSDSATTDKENIDFTIKEWGSSSTTSKTKASVSSFIRETISNRELLQETEEVITDSCRTFTRSS